MTPSTLEIRTATAADAGRVGALVAECFHDDPLTEWLVPRSEHRPTILPGYFADAVAAAVEDGAVYVLGDLEGAAVWFDVTTPVPAPAADPDPHTVQACGPYADRFHRIDHLMHAAQAPQPPHHQLAFLVVREPLRNAGHGRRLLAAHDARLAEAGLPAYLNATHPDSRRLYLRQGWHDLTAPYAPPGGAPIWPMWRPGPA